MAVENLKLVVEGTHVDLTHQSMIKIHLLVRCNWLARGTAASSERKLTGVSLIQNVFIFYCYFVLVVVVALDK